MFNRASLARSEREVRSSVIRAALVGALVTVVGCAADPVPYSPPEDRTARGTDESSEPSAVSVQLPYTAEELRAALPVGTRWTFRTVALNRAPQDETSTVLAATDETVTRSVETRLADRTTTAEVTGRWQELITYDVFRRDAKIEERRVDLLDGPRDCWVYTVESEKDGVVVQARFDFLRDEPGPPARITTRVDGRVLVTSTLSSFDRSPAPPADDTKDN